MKSPFIELSLEKYNEKIKEIIEHEKCKIISSYDITNDIKNEKYHHSILDECDYIVFFDIYDFHDFNKKYKKIYDKMHKQYKLLYIGNYNYLLNISMFKNLKLVLNVDISQKHNKFFMSNLLIHLFIEQTKRFIITNKTLNFIHYISSSLLQINIDLDLDTYNLKKNSFNNLPNKIKLLNFTTFSLFKIKCPYNAILIINEYSPCRDETLKNTLKHIININTKLTVITFDIIKRDFYDYNSGYKHYSDIIIKNNTNIYLNTQINHICGGDHRILAQYRNEYYNNAIFLTIISKYNNILSQEMSLLNHNKGNKINKFRILEENIKNKNDFINNAVELMSMKNKQ
jgi:hypothetical protein